MDIQRFFDDQLNSWDDARNRFHALSEVLTKQIQVASETISVQYNPARAVSSLAKLDTKTLAQRPCFLCHDNRPRQQHEILVLSRYHLLVNPFPIFSPHFTIASTTHQLQSLSLATVLDMLSLASQFPHHVVFFNGAKAGASAPDHLHLQMISASSLTNPVGIRSSLRKNTTLQSSDAESLADEILAAIGSFHLNAGLFNLLVLNDGSRWTADIYRRKTHRPTQYFDQSFMISPGAIDMAGTVIASRLEDYEKASPALLSDVFAQVADD